MPNKEDDMYLVIGTEDGYFDTVDMKEYKKAKKRLEEGYYNTEKVWENLIMTKRKIKMSPEFYNRVRTQADIYKDNNVHKFWGLEVEIDKNLKEDYEIVEEEY